MKISNDRLDVLAGAEALIEKTEKKASGAGPSQTGQSADSLTLSPELRMLQSTAQGDSVGVRDEVVARMRKLMLDGEIGADASALADAIIDSWLSDGH